MPPTVIALADRRLAAWKAIIAAVRSLAREHGFKGAQMALIAARAGVGVGLIYKLFASRTALFAEVYRRVVTQERVILEAAIADVSAGPVARLEIAVRTFCTRAIRAGRFAHALLVEPVDETIDEHRLVFRESYRVIFARLLTEAIEQGELPPQDADTSAAAVLGIMTETLVRPLGGTEVLAPDLVERIVQLSLAALAGLPPRKPTRGRTSPTRRRKR